jgi:hypothetical protein
MDRNGKESGIMANSVFAPTAAAARPQAIPRQPYLNIPASSSPIRL